MIDPLFWLGLSILLVAVSLTAVLIALLPAVQELARAARSAEKLFDTLRRELPPTLEAIRLTGMEISDLTDDVNEGVKSATQVVKQVDRSVGTAKKQAQNVQVSTKSVLAGVKAAWRTFRQPGGGRRGSDRLPPSQRTPVEFRYSREISAEADLSRKPSRPSIGSHPDSDLDNDDLSFYPDSQNYSSNAPLEDEEDENTNS